MFYIIIISIVMAGTLISTICVSCIAETMTLSYAIIAPIFVLLYVLVLLGILDLILRFLFPKSCFDHKRRYFNVSKKERRFYEKIKIRSWKDRVPELGKTAGFSKSSLQSTQLEYLEKFIYETCIGEILHLSGALLGFTCLLIFPVRDFYFVLPIVIVNFVLNLLPCFIQRYNRAKLLVVYNFKLKHTKNVAPESQMLALPETEQTT